MRRAPTILLILLGALLALSACGREQEGDAAPPAAPDTAEEGGVATLTGTFNGDAQLEGGCAWLDVGGTRYEVFYPPGYTVHFEPALVLEGPEGETVAERGDPVTVTGELAEDAMSICQVGPIFEAAEVQGPT